VIAWIFPLLLGFFSTPILVHYLGNEQYGLLAIVLGFISYSFTFGIGKVAGKYVPEFRANGETEKVTQVISGTFWLSLTVGVVGGGVLALLAPTIVTRLLLITPDMQQAAIYSLYLAAAIGVVLMLSQVFQFVLQGLHRFDNYTALTNLSGLLLGVGNIVLALNGFGVTALLAWNLLVVATIGVLFYIRAKHLLPSISLGTNMPRSMMGRVVRYAGNTLLFQIFANVVFIFERTWVTRKFGTDGLTYYYVPMLLPIYMHGFLGSLVQATFPVVNEILDQRDRVAQLYRRANKVILAIVVFSITNFIVCGALFLKLWINADLAANSYRMLIPHGLTYGVIALGIMTFQIAESYRGPLLNVIWTASWALIAIPLMILVAGQWQSEGVAWARVAASLGMFPAIAYAESSYLGGIQWRFWLTSALRTLVAGGAMAAVEYFILAMLGDSYLSLVLAGGAGTLVFGSLLALSGFFTHEDREVIRRNLLRR
jgi:O-antigen/teichoic acid export membrane protein